MEKVDDITNRNNRTGHLYHKRRGQFGNICRNLKIFMRILPEYGELPQYKYLFGKLARISRGVGVDLSDISLL